MSVNVLLPVLSYEMEIDSIVVSDPNTNKNVAVYALNGYSADLFCDEEGIVGIREWLEED